MEATGERVPLEGMGFGSEETGAEAPSIGMGFGSEETGAEAPSIGMGFVLEATGERVPLEGMGFGTGSTGAVALPLPGRTSVEAKFQRLLASPAHDGDSAAAFPSRRAQRERSPLSPDGRATPSSYTKPSKHVTRNLVTPVSFDTPISELGYNLIFDKKPKWLGSVKPGTVIENFQVLFNKCQLLGLHCRPVICIQNYTGRFLVGGAQEEIDEIVLNIHQRLYPICTQGMNRSQLFWLAASRKVEAKYLAPPHGAIRGHDPYFTPVVTTSDDEDPLQDIDRAKKGLKFVERTERFGRGYSADKFEEKYWLPIIREGGTLVIVGKAVHAVMMRLLQVAEKHSLDLSSVHVQPISRKDPFHAPKKDGLREKKVLYYINAVNNIQFTVDA